jgi:hypothetical protein
MAALEGALLDDQAKTSGRRIERRPHHGGVRLKVGFAVMKLALPSPIDVPIAHRALHEFQPDWVELEMSEYSSATSSN